MNFYSLCISSLKLPFRNISQAIYGLRSLSTDFQSENSILSVFILIFAYIFLYDTMSYNFDEIIERENTNSVKYDLRKEYFGNPSVMPLWVADMDFATPDFIRKAVIKRAQHPVYGYTVRKDEFKNAIIRWIKNRHGWEVNPGWICFSPGIVPALNMSVLAFTRENSNILIQPPVYYPFFNAVKDHKRILTENELTNNRLNYSINFSDFEEKAASADVFILCHPHNPVGRLWTREELTQIVGICKKHNTLIISDEIHSDIILTRDKHTPLLTIPGSEEICVSMYAPSKTFNLAGLATSFLIIPNQNLREKYEQTLNSLHMGMGNIFGAEALIAAYTYGESWLEELLSYLNNNVSFLTKFLKEKLPEIKPVQPEATYLVWLDFSDLNITDDALKDFLIHEAGIGLNHGPVFGKGGQGFQRMNIALPKARLELALNKLEKAIRSRKQK